jgi:hypothetical protein
MTRPLIALALLGVVGCGSPEHPNTRGGGQSMLVFTDHLTGCQYLYFYNGGITPRLSPDGTQICERPEGQKEERE